MTIERFEDITVRLKEQELIVGTCLVKANEVSRITTGLINHQPINCPKPN